MNQIIKYGFSEKDYDELVHEFFINELEKYSDDKTMKEAYKKILRSKKMFIKIFPSYFMLDLNTETDSDVSQKYEQLSNRVFAFLDSSRHVFSKIESEKVRKIVVRFWKYMCHIIKSEAEGFKDAELKDCMDFLVDITMEYAKKIPSKYSKPVQWSFIDEFEHPMH